MFNVFSSSTLNSIPLLTCFLGLSIMINSWTYGIGQSDRQRRPTMSHLVVVGGSDAGISAALRAGEVDPGMDIIVIVADRFPNFSICGIPFYISGEIKDWHTLAHRTADDIKQAGIHLLLEHRAESIDSQKKTLTIKDPDGKKASLKYDKLILCTGALSIQPKIKGIELPGVFFLRWMEDGFALRHYLDDKRPSSAVIIGGGYIGMEMADAFSFRRMNVMVIEYAETVLTTLDPELGKQVVRALGRRGVHVVTRTPVTSIEQVGSTLRVSGGDHFHADAQVVLVAAGARPNIGLAVSAGVNIGDFGAMRVNRRMETNVADIYAAGDCVETWSKLTGKYGYMPLGTTAHKQGRVAGENAAGGQNEYRGSLGTQVVKIFDWVAARTGLRDIEAKAAGFDPLTIELECWDHKEYYPVAQKLTLRMTGDRNTKRLFGVQIFGHRDAEISKRVDIIAAALFNEMKMNEIGDLDLSYTPPLSSPWDPLQMAAQEWIKKDLNQ